MKVKKFITGPIETNTYLVYDEKSKEAVLMDVGGSAKEIEVTINDLDLKLKYILNTHGHFDHVLGAKQIQDELNCEFYIHKLDAIWVKNLATQVERFIFTEVIPPEITGNFNEKSEFNIGDIPIQIIETPGHSRGSVSFLIGKVLFSGDTLFYNSIGRTDLPGGSLNRIKSSIKDKLFLLPDDTLVLPGHDQKTSIGFEKINNKQV